MQSVIDPRISPPWAPIAQSRTQSLSRTIFLAVAASALVALCAHLSLPLPFTPVPITMQTFAVILLGMVLGPRLGFAAMSLYLAEGMAGMPVFSPQGPGGVIQLLGPTGGFLLSYPLAAALAGTAVRLLQRALSPFPAAALAGVLASVPIFIFGAGWLSFALHLSFSGAWRLAVVPFLPGEDLKLIAVAGFFTLMQRLRRS